MPLTPAMFSNSDMIAIPDFSSGAMENWGLITYRETALLFNEGVSSEGNKQRVAVVVSHELAHQVCRNSVSLSVCSNCSVLLLIKIIKNNFFQNVLGIMSSIQQFFK